MECIRCSYYLYHIVLAHIRMSCMHGIPGDGECNYAVNVEIIIIIYIIILFVGRD